MPYGENGFQLAGLIYQTVHTMNSTMIASLIITMMSLVFFVWLMPMDSTQVMMSTITKPGRLKYVVTPGVVPYAAVSSTGRCKPKPSNSLLKYPDHPADTVAACNAYSKIKSQPITNAISSPNAKYAYEYAEPDTGAIAANSA